MNSAPKRKRVSFALDEPEFLFKPKPAKVAIYVVGSGRLIAEVKTAKQIEEEEIASFKKLRVSNNAWRPKRRRLPTLEQQFLEDDNDDDMQDAIWELLQNAVKLDQDSL